MYDISVYPGAGDVYLVSAFDVTPGCVKRLRRLRDASTNFYPSRYEVTFSNIREAALLKLVKRYNLTYGEMIEASYMVETAELDKAWLRIQMMTERDT